MRANGSALISALFIMTIVAIVATAMSIRLQLEIYRTQVVINQDKLYLASQAVTFWAMDALHAKKSSFVALDQHGKILVFPKTLEKIYPDVTTRGQLYDLQAKFNLNNLYQGEYHPLFTHLLEHSSTLLNQSDQKELISAILHWISPLSDKDARNRYVSFYMTQTPSYYPAYQALQHVSELKLIYGVKPDLYQSLEPNLTTLPEITPININTAPINVLKSLGKGLTTSQVNTIIKNREEAGLESLTALHDLNLQTNQITFESRYFLCIAHTHIKNQHLSVYTVLKRNKDKRGFITTSIIHQRFNAE